ncbi:hypothetical protein EJ06DRAFT_62897 [Trichodelitschia bisporula]|uniref:Uncharacterized protein n=1 Tax=Trichodelitschia bisporula TaxID=703511 RepID=A0A6G1HVF2_9PEZI|nr:hypothetical protein EJ06DRAFT_62897 [Trichodelitschia bisporula]
MAALRMPRRPAGQETLKPAGQEHSSIASEQAMEPKPRENGKGVEEGISKSLKVAEEAESSPVATKAQERERAEGTARALVLTPAKSTGGRPLENRERGKAILSTAVAEVMNSSWGTTMRELLDDMGPRVAPQLEEEESLRHAELMRELAAKGVARIPTGEGTTTTAQEGSEESYSNTSQVVDEAASTRVSELTGELEAKASKAPEAVETTKAPEPAEEAATAKAVIASVSTNEGGRALDIADKMKKVLLSWDLGAIANSSLDPLQFSNRLKALLPLDRVPVTKPPPMSDEMEAVVSPTVTEKARSLWDGKRATELPATGAAELRTREAGTTKAAETTVKDAEPARTAEGPSKPTGTAQPAEQLAMQPVASETAKEPAKQAETAKAVEGLSKRPNDTRPTEAAEASSSPKAKGEVFPLPMDKFNKAIGSMRTAAKGLDDIATQFQDIQAKKAGAASGSPKAEKELSERPKGPALEQLELDHLVGQFKRPDGEFNMEEVEAHGDLEAVLELFTELTELSEGQKNIGAEALGRSTEDVAEEISETQTKKASNAPGDPKAAEEPCRKPKDVWAEASGEPKAAKELFEEPKGLETEASGDPEAVEGQPKKAKAPVLEEPNLPENQFLGPDGQVNMEVVKAYGEDGAGLKFIRKLVAQVEGPKDLGAEDLGAESPRRSRNDVADKTADMPAKIAGKAPGYPRTAEKPSEKPKATEGEASSDPEAAKELFEEPKGLETEASGDPEAAKKLSEGPKTPGDEPDFTEFGELLLSNGQRNMNFVKKLGGDEGVWKVFKALDELSKGIIPGDEGLELVSIVSTEIAHLRARKAGKTPDDRKAIEEPSGKPKEAGAEVPGDPEAVKKLSEGPKDLWAEASGDPEAVKELSEGPKDLGAEASGDLNAAEGPSEWTEEALLTDATEAMGNLQAAQEFLQGPQDPGAREVIERLGGPKEWLAWSGGPKDAVSLVQWHFELGKKTSAIEAAQASGGSKAAEGLPKEPKDPGAAGASEASGLQEVAEKPSEGPNDPVEDIRQEIEDMVGKTGPQIMFEAIATLEEPAIKEAVTKLLMEDLKRWESIGTAEAAEAPGDTKAAGKPSKGPKDTSAADLVEQYGFPVTLKELTHLRAVAEEILGGKALQLTNILREQVERWGSTPAAEAAETPGDPKAAEKLSEGPKGTSAREATKASERSATVKELLQGEKDSWDPKVVAELGRKEVVEALQRSSPELTGTWATVAAGQSSDPRAASAGEPSDPAKGKGKGKEKTTRLSSDPPKGKEKKKVTWLPFDPVRELPSVKDLVPSADPKRESSKAGESSVASKPPVYTAEASVADVTGRGDQDKKEAGWKPVLSKKEKKKEKSAGETSDPLKGKENEKEKATRLPSDPPKGKGKEKATGLPFDPVKDFPRVGDLVSSTDAKPEGSKAEDSSVASKPPMYTAEASVADIMGLGDQDKKEEGWKPVLLKKEKKKEKSAGEASDPPKGEEKEKEKATRLPSDPPKGKGKEKATGLPFDPVKDLPPVKGLVSSTDAKPKGSKAEDSSVASNPPMYTAEASVADIMGLGDEDKKEEGKPALSKNWKKSKKPKGG